MVRWMKCCLAALVVVLWMLSIIILSLATIIRDNLSKIVLVTEGTAVGDFYLKIFFPVIFPILITVSCFIFIIGCLGCFGTFTDSQRLLGWFFFSVLVTLCIELSAGIWRMVEYDMHYNESDVSQLKYNIIKRGGLESMTWFTNAWKEVHHKFNCCGVYSFEDWWEVDSSLILSCCPTSMPNKCDDKSSFRHMNGCGEKLLSYLSSSSYINAVPYLTAFTGVVQVIALVITLKIWLIFCFTSRSGTKNSTELTVYPTLYQCNEEQLTQEQELNENGRYLTPLKSYEDYRYSERSDTMKQRQKKAKQQKVYYPIYLVPEVQKEERFNANIHGQEIESTSFLEPKYHIATVTSSENIGRYRQPSQSSFPQESIRHQENEQARFSHATNLTAENVIVSNSNAETHSRTGTTDRQSSLTSSCRLNSHVKIRAGSVQKNNKWKHTRRKNGDSLSDSAIYNTSEKEDEQQTTKSSNVNQVLNGKVQTKAGLTDCDISFEMAVHYNTPHTSRMGEKKKSHTGTKVS